MEWKKIKSPKQQISNFFGSQGSHIDYSSFPRNAWVLKWKLVFFSFGRQICITVPERKRGEMGMKIASLQLKKRANALIVFRFREKSHTLLSLRPQWKCRAFWERVGPRTPWVKSVENFEKKKTEYCQMLKSSKGHKFRAKLGSVRFHYLKAVVCMYARSTKKISSSIWPKKITLNGQLLLFWGQASLFVLTCPKFGF